MFGYIVSLLAQVEMERSLNELRKIDRKRKHIDQEYLHRPSPFLSLLKQQPTKTTMSTVILKDKDGKEYRIKPEFLEEVKADELRVTPDEYGEYRYVTSIGSNGTESFYPNCILDEKREDYNNIFRPDANLDRLIEVNKFNNRLMQIVTECGEDGQFNAAQRFRISHSINIFGEHIIMSFNDGDEFQHVIYMSKETAGKAVHQLRKEYNAKI